MQASEFREENNEILKHIDIAIKEVLGVLNMHEGG